MRGKRSEKSVRSCRKTDRTRAFILVRKRVSHPARYPRGVKCRVAGLAEVQLWLLTTFFYGTYAKIKDRTAAVVLEDGSTPYTSCVCFGCSWWGNCI